MISKKQELLHTPEGVWDHYGVDLKEYREISGRILGKMHLYGYEDIKTPAFEYFDVFSREVGTTPSRELYKFFDRAGDTLVLRPDFTPSVARCTAKYFMDETKPLRFCYEGSAFVNITGLQGKLSESTQMGAELMNDASVYADGEMLALLIESLLGTGLTQFQITVGNVEYFKGICDAAGLDEETEAQLRDYISGKNYYAAESLLIDTGVEKEYQEQFLKITDFFDGAEELREVLSTAPNERSREAVQRLIDLMEVLRCHGLEKYVSCDLSLLSKYRYYTGIIFKGYTYGVGEAIATGGRYDALLEHFGKKAPAIGFMIGLDTLIEALRMQHIPIHTEEDPEVVFYYEDNYEEQLQKVREMRKEGIAAILCPAEG